MRNYILSSIKGINHIKNEDDVLVIEKPAYQLFFVFDGVGSSKHSDDAIQLVSEYVTNHHQKYIDNEDCNFIDLMFDANSSIVASGIKDAYTTYCSVFNHEKSEGNITISNLGDSRIYTVKENDIELLSKDDKDSPDTHIINKCLGDDTLIRKDFRQTNKHVNGHKILLTTDGFHDMMEPELNVYLKQMEGIYLKPVKDKLEKMITGKNLDDSTFVIIK